MKVYYEIVASVGGQGKPLPAAFSSEEITRSVWQTNVQAAEANNLPGTFTALIGYEWSSNTDGNNLHRVVVFRDGADKTEQILPFSSFDSDNPEDLWKFLQNYETKTGGSVLAIPHNGNLSNGLMFPLINPVGGKPLTAEYARTRASLEPLMEVTQIEGRRGDASHLCLRMTSSPTSSGGTWETSTSAWRRRRRCWSSSMRARLSRTA